MKLKDEANRRGNHFPNKGRASELFVGIGCLAFLVVGTVAQQIEGLETVEVSPTRTEYKRNGKRILRTDKENQGIVSQTAFVGPFAVVVVTSVRTSDLEGAEIEFSMMQMPSKRGERLEFTRKAGKSFLRILSSDGRIVECFEIGEDCVLAPISTPALEGLRKCRLQAIEEVGLGN